MSLSSTAAYWPVRLIERLDAGRVGEQVMAGHRGRARIRADQGGQDADHRGLARAVRAEEGEDRAGVDGKIDVIECEVAAEGLGDADAFTVYGIHKLYV